MPELTFQLPLDSNVGKLPKEPLHRIAARLRSGMNPKGFDLGGKR
jgi:hypothetical protein